MLKDCNNCEHHTWGDEWWNCETECYKCRYTDRQGEKVPSNWKSIPMTNADRIRAMSDEELARFIPDWSYTPACKCDEKPYVDCNNECDKCVLEWLQQPAEVE